MKKTTFFLLLASIFSGCGESNNDSNNYSVCMDNCKKFGNTYEYCKQDCANDASSHNNTSGGGNNSDKIQELRDNSVLSSSDRRKIEEFCSNTHYQEECYVDIEIDARLYKAIGCLDTFIQNDYCYDVEDNDSSEKGMRSCVTKNITPYISALENHEIYKAFVANNNRWNNCCSQWGQYSSSECREAQEEFEVYKHLTGIYFLLDTDSCLSKEAELWKCESKLSCFQPIIDDEDDEAVYAFCYDRNSSHYIGDRYSSTAQCKDSLTYYCQNEFERLEACQNDY